MTRPILHVVFNPSAAASLRDALKQLGRNDEVVAFFDDYRYGPIEPLAPAAREAWIGDELGWDMEGFLPHWHDEFWSKALADDVHRVVWTTRRWAGERVGFLAWVSRIGDAAVDVVDLTDVELSEPLGCFDVPPPHYAILPLLPPARILAERLIERARPLTVEERDAAQKDWARLASENAPLRVTDNLEIISAPITFFDDTLMSCAIGEWRKMARIIGDALVLLLEGQGHDTSDILLAARIRSLIDEGRIEVRGDPDQMRYCEIRLPQR